MSKLKNVTAQIWIVDKDGNKTGKSYRKHQIYRSSQNRGVIINDGREVYRNKGGEWCYEPTK